MGHVIGHLVEAADGDLGETGIAEQRVEIAFEALGHEGLVVEPAFLVLQGGLNLSFEQVRAYVSRQIDVVVQMARDGGRRRISDVVWSKP